MADRWLQAELPGTLAMCAPAVRTVVVLAWHDDDDHEWKTQVCPVLAVVGKQRFRYHKQWSPDRAALREHPTHEGMIRNGWTYDDTLAGWVEWDMLIAPGWDGYDICLASEMDDVDSLHSEVVVFDWPPDRDVEELVGAVERVKADAVKYAGWAAERKAAEAAKATPNEDTR